MPFYIAADKCFLEVFLVVWRQGDMKPHRLNGVHNLFVFGKSNKCYAYLWYQK